MRIRVFDFDDSYKVKRERLGKGSTEGENSMNKFKGGMGRTAICMISAILCSLFVYGCVTTQTAVEGEDQKELKASATVEAIQVIKKGDGARITIYTSSKTRYALFKMDKPPRLFIDIEGLPSPNLKRQTIVDDVPIVNTLKLKEREGDLVSTRIELGLSSSKCDYSIDSQGADIVLDLFPSERVSAKVTPIQSPGQPTSYHKATNVPEQKSRTFFKPGSSALNQILGLDFAPLEKGRSRATITSSKKLDYSTKMKEGKHLLVLIKDATIPDLLKRRMDSKYFEGAVKAIKASSSVLDKTVLVDISLRELVPYHISQKERELKIDFGASSERPASLNLNSTKGKIGNEKADKDESSARRYDVLSKDYAGMRMSFDFIDTDIRNILKLIAEAIGMNIVWGSDVEGKISLKLDDVPWDQALEMVLKPNDLTYTIEGNVMWVVPKSKLIDMEIKERERTKSLLAQKQIEEVFQPKVVEYIVIKNRKVEDIFRMLIGDKEADPPKPGILELEGAAEKVVSKGEEEGKKTEVAKADLYLTYDSGTNTIILNGVRAKIDKVKEMVAKLDVPEKQVMIQARIVDATSSFSRDLGVQWNTMEGLRRGDQAQNWGVTAATGFNNPNDLLYGGSLSSNSPATWTPNIGLSFARLTSSGLGAISLDASLALAETEGKAHIISAPKVITMNGQEATISRGTILYKDVVTADQIDTKEITATLSLTVTPTTSADNSHVTMTVEVTDDTAISVNEKQEKKIETKLMVRNGETVVIGGIFKEDTVTEEAGYPWAKDIPVLGWLFKAETKTREKSELLIFLTPQVIEGTTLQ